MARKEIRNERGKDHGENVKGISGKPKKVKIVQII
jgi:hypothetical protein